MTHAVHDEGELRFRFPARWQVEVFDAPGRLLPKYVAPVDFVIGCEDRLLLLEIKDPSASGVPPDEIDRFVDKMSSTQLVDHELVPKARTTWSYLHLMGRTGRPLHYVVAIGVERLMLPPTLMGRVEERLRSRLRHEVDVPWAVPYVQRADVVPVLELDRVVPGLSVRRIVDARGGA